jgi:hypothetical protein
MLWIPSVNICLAGPGATDPRFEIRGWVTEWPISPSTEMITISIGKIAKTP